MGIFEEAIEETLDEIHGDGQEDFDQHFEAWATDRHVNIEKANFAFLAYLRGLQETNEEKITNPEPDFRDDYVDESA